MGYASQSGRARASSTNPRAFAVCDRCGIWYNRQNLHWQFDWAGASLINKRILVCGRCTDTPQEQLRAIVIPADPVPIDQPRLEYFANDETNWLTVGNATNDPITGISIPPTTTLAMQDGSILTMQPLGNPRGLSADAQAPLVIDMAWNVPLPVSAITANGTRVVSVACSTPHGLSGNAQVSVQGVVPATAAGVFSVNVTGLTTFTYTAPVAINSGSLLTPATRSVTMNVGLPYDYAAIPQTGV